jgi:hypothetical protein
MLLSSKGAKVRLLLDELLNKRIHAKASHKPKDQVCCAVL